jgi:phosphoglycolate phosphatase-like HAD superfamily hydrolase
MIRAIFFDFDGTISDTRSFISETLIETLEAEEYFFDKSKLNQLLGERIVHLLKALGIQKETEIIRKKFYKNLAKKVKHMAIRPCVSLNHLNYLHKKYLTIVISNAETSFVKLQAKQLKVNKYFKELIGAEALEPKDKIMKRLFKKYKLKPKEVIYIGDRFSDIEYSRKAGCWAVAIHNNCSWSSRKTIISEHPDFIIKDFSEIDKVIRKINTTKN